MSYNKFAIKKNSQSILLQIIQFSIQHVRINGTTKKKRAIRTHVDGQTKHGHDEKRVSRSTKRNKVRIVILDEGWATGLVNDRI